MKLSDYQYYFFIRPTSTASNYKSQHCPLTKENWQEKVFYLNGKTRKGIQNIIIYRGRFDIHNYREYLEFCLHKRRGSEDQWLFYAHVNDGEGRLIKSPFKTYTILMKYIDASRKIAVE